MNQEVKISTALAEETRLRIVALLNNSRICVKCLALVLESPQPTVSRHLSVLRNTGLVGYVRTGMHSHYCLDLQGGFGSFKRKLVAAYKNIFSAREPYVSDGLRLAALSRTCDANCRVNKNIKKRDRKKL